MPKNGLPLEENETGSLADLSARPNPSNLIICHVPPLAALLQEMARRAGRPLKSKEEAEHRRNAPCIVLSKATVAKLFVSNPHLWPRPS